MLLKEGYVTEKRGRRRKRLVDELKETRGQYKLKEQALDRVVWRSRFGRGCELSNSKSSALKLTAHVKLREKILVLSNLLRQFGEEQIRRKTHVSDMTRNECKSFTQTFMI